MPRWHWTRWVVAGLLSLGLVDPFLSLDCSETVSSRFGYALAGVLLWAVILGVGGWWRHDP